MFVILCTMYINCCLFTLDVFIIIIVLLFIVSEKNLTFFRRFVGLNNFLFHNWWTSHFWRFYFLSFCLRNFKFFRIYIALKNKYTGNSPNLCISYLPSVLNQLFFYSPRMYQLSMNKSLNQNLLNIWLIANVAERY